MYSVGKGPSATTVSTQTTVAPLGSSVLIQGTVTDQSAGAKGTPAISDKDMGAWMLYVYNQFPMPTNATGVPVQITAIGSDGTQYQVGTATSNLYGNYGITWTPPSQGTYQIVANFMGTGSYGNSFASTYLAIGAAVSPQATATAPPTATPSPTQPPATTSPTQTVAPTPSPVVVPPGNGIPTATYLAIGAAVIIIVAVAAAFALRKRNK